MSRSPAEAESPTLMVVEDVPVPAADEALPFTLELPGTAVSFAMLPVTRADGSVFWMSSTEVPWEAFDVFVYGFEIPRERRVAEFDAASRPSKPYGSPDRGWGHDGFPAFSMTAESAEAFCTWAGGLSDAALRLPSVSEWELAARAGAQRPPGVAEVFAPADRELPGDLGTAVGWAPANGPRTSAVDSEEPNALGFHALLGNVGEWARTADGEHVLCGGHFIDDADARVPWRRERQTPAWNSTDPQNPKSRWWLSDAPFVGFRIATSDRPDSL